LWAHPSEEEDMAAADQQVHEVVEGGGERSTRPGDDG
jgi:hypothetical protein